MPNNSLRLRFDETTHPRPADRIAAWRDAMSLSVDVAFRAEDRPGFAGSVDLHRLGAVLLVDSRLTPHAMARTRQTIARSAHTHVVLDAILSGGFRGTIGGRRLVVRPGDCFVMDLKKTLRVQLDATRCIGAIMPRRLIEAQTGGTGPLHGMHLGAASPEARLLVPLLQGLVEEVPRLSQARAAALGAGLIGLIGACLTEREAAAGDGAALGDPTLTRVLRHIERHAPDPDLDGQRLCAAFGLSRAALYRLFEPEGGVAKIIRRRRAAVAHRLLCDDPLRSIAAVARDSGFSDTRSLRRALHDAYDASPSQLRRGALQSEAAGQEQRQEYRIEVGALLDGSGDGPT